jgi:hypothetical protein
MSRKSKAANKELGLQRKKPQPPTGTAEAMAFMIEHEMKKDKKPVKFLYYNEKKIDK